MTTRRLTTDWTARIAGAGLAATLVLTGCGGDDGGSDQGGGGDAGPSAEAPASEAADTPAADTPAEDAAGGDTTEETGSDGAGEGPGQEATAPITPDGTTEEPVDAPPEESGDEAPAEEGDEAEQPTEPEEPAPSAEQPAPEPSTSSSEEARPSSSGGDDGEECAQLSEQDAFLQNVDKVPPAFPDDPDIVWSQADGSTYHPCAGLSWITLGIRGTASSPFQIMLFHEGEYLGTTLAKAPGFFPDVRRVDDDTLEVTYRYPKEGEANAEASGRAVSQFTWSDKAGKVVHSGELPPGL
ncbi:LppP/LprE family lipoprotein [Kytococcus sp. Marseille-QA3725]